MATATTKKVCEDQSMVMPSSRLTSYQSVSPGGVHCAVHCCLLLHRLLRPGSERARQSVFVACYACLFVSAQQMRALHDGAATVNRTRAMRAALLQHRNDLRAGSQQTEQPCNARHQMRTAPMRCNKARSLLDDLHHKVSRWVRVQGQGTGSERSIRGAKVMRDCLFKTQDLLLVTAYTPCCRCGQSRGCPSARGEKEEHEGRGSALSSYLLLLLLLPPLLCPGRPTPPLSCVAG